MNTAALNLVVLRCSDIERAAAFYSQLGLQFSKHRHGKGPEHFAAELGDAVFELYPSSPDGSSTLGTRIGFGVTSLDTILPALGDAVTVPARDCEWGRGAVVIDPDGHRVELLEA